MTIASQWYQHEHERIGSRSQRWVSGGVGGAAYTSSESIGYVIPTVPDQTYGGGGVPTGAVTCTLNAGSSVNYNYIHINTLVNIPPLYSFLILVVSGSYYHVGYVFSSESWGSGVKIGVYSNTGISIAIDGVVVTGAIYWYDNSLMPTPNVIIYDPAMVSLEYSSPSLWGGNPRAIAPVKVYKRKAPMVGLAGHVALDTGLTLPCKLEPGYYAFATETGNFADHPTPSTDQTEADATPFAISFERPRYICDLAAGLTQRDEPHNTDLGFDHRQGLASSNICKNGAVYVACQGKSASYDSALCATWIWAASYMMVHMPHWYAENLLSVPSFHACKDEDRWASVTAYHWYGGKHYIGEQSTTHVSANTGGLVGSELDLSGNTKATIGDTGNRGAPIPYGASNDVFLEGSVEVKAGDIITLVKPGDTVPAYDADWFFVEAVEPYFGDPLSVGSSKFYTLLTIYPQLEPDDDGTWDSYADYTCYTYKQTRRLGRLLRYDANWTNQTVLRECVIDTGRDKDGATIGRLMSGAPLGEKKTVEYDNDTHLYITKLEGQVIGTPVVYRSDRIQLTVINREPQGTPKVFAIPDNPMTAYYATQCGDDSIESWLIYHPDMAGQDAYIDYQACRDDIYISQIWHNDGVVYALESGTGLLLEESGDTVIISDMGRSQSGAQASPVQVTNEDIWTISSPGGFLTRHNKYHSGHVDNLSVNPGVRLIDILAEACQAMGMILFVDVSGRLYATNRSAQSLGQSIMPIRPSPELSSPLTPDSVRVSYSGGEAQAGKSNQPRTASVVAIETFQHAQILADLWRTLDRTDRITVSIPIESDVFLGDTLIVPYPNTIIDESDTITGTVIGLAMDMERQHLNLTLRRL